MLSPVEIPAPEPWLQYGALGLLGLVLSGLAVFLAIAAKAAGAYMNRIAGAIEGFTEEFAGFKGFVSGKLESIETRDGEFRAKLDSLTRKDSDPPARPTLPRGRPRDPRDEPHVTRHPTRRMTPEHTRAVWEELERRERSRVTPPPESPPAPPRAPAGRYHVKRPGEP
jgi:hypothetical protein